MKHLLCAAALLYISSGVACASQRSGTVTLDVDLSAQEKGKEVRLWIPYPVSDRHQLVSGLRVSGDFSSSGVYTDPASGTPILYAEWPSGASARKLSFSFAVQRQEVARREFPPSEPAWNSADYAEFLKPTRLGPVDGEVKILADRITRGKKTVLERARAIYDWCCENMYRDPATRGCGKGDVCSLLQKPGGKCTDISSVFVALCRASGVPAREIFGIRLGKSPQEEITGYQHCWAEFFVPGYGWVPADPADVRKAMLVEKLELKDARALAYREYFWGGIDAFRVALATGRDIVLNPPQSGTPLNTFGYPYAESGGTPLDFYNPKTFRYTITYTDK